MIKVLEPPPLSGLIRETRGLLELPRLMFCVPRPALANRGDTVNLFCCYPDTAREMAQPRSLSAICACWAIGSGAGVLDEILAMSRI